MTVALSRVSVLLATPSAAGAIASFAQAARTSGECQVRRRRDRRRAGTGDGRPSRHRATALHRAPLVVCRARLPWKYLQGIRRLRKGDGGRSTSGHPSSCEGVRRARRVADAVTSAVDRGAPASTDRRVPCFDRRSISLGSGARTPVRRTRMTLDACATLQLATLARASAGDTSGARDRIGVRQERRRATWRARRDGARARRDEACATGD